MTRETYHTDASHGIRLPTGRRLRVVLERILRRQAQEAHAALNAGRVPNLQPWLPVMVETLTPLYAELAVWGARRAQGRILETMGGRRAGKSLSPYSTSDRQSDRFSTTLRRNLSGHNVKSVIDDHRKAVGAVNSLWDPSITVGFDVFNPRVLDSVQQAVLAFCQSTIDTLTQDIREALAGIRGTLGAGLQAGETTAQLNRRVGMLVSDPMRAARISQSEASRAVHGGAWVQDKEAGISLKKWYASSDACSICLSIAARGAIPMDEPFIVYPRGGPYAVVMHPPAHPWCLCSSSGVVEEAMVA